MHIDSNVGLAIENYEHAIPARDERRGWVADGWAVPPEGHKPLPNQFSNIKWLTAAHETMESWTSWLDRSDDEKALLSCVHLGDVLLVRGEHQTLVDGIRRHGTLSALALVRRLDEHVAMSYVEEASSMDDHAGSVIGNSPRGRQATTCRGLPSGAKRLELTFTRSPTRTMGRTSAPFSRASRD